MSRYGQFIQEDMRAYRGNSFMASVRRNGFILGVMVWVVKAIIRGAAFPTFSMLRSSIGKNTFGLVSIGIAYLFADFLSHLPMPIRSREDVDVFFTVLGGWLGSRDLPVVSNALHYARYVILGFGFFHLMYYQVVPEHLKPMENSRGRSWMFRWAGNNPNLIDPQFVQRIVEPIAVICVGFFLSIVTAIEHNLGWFLILSGSAFLSEELKAFSLESSYMDPTRR